MNSPPIRHSHPMPRKSHPHPAVKVLLDLEEAAQQRSAEAAWTLSNPILHNLQKASHRGRA